MVEIIMDDEKIKRDGIYDLNDVHRIFDDLVINRKGLRKEGNFYIDDNPYDSAGVGAACFFHFGQKTMVSRQRERNALVQGYPALRS